MKVKFKNDEVRHLFFSKIKESYSAPWQEIYKTLGVSKPTFERYKSGASTIPKDLFEKLVNELDSSLKNKIPPSVEELPDNYGQVIGGKLAYVKNTEYFDKGRLKGLISIRDNRQKEVISFKDLELTPEIYEFIGAFIGDGMFNVYNNKLYQVAFACDKRYDLDYYEKTIIPAVKKIQPDVIPRIYDYHNRENAVRIVFYSKKIFMFLKDFCGFTPGRKAHTIKIPEIFFNQEAIRNKIIRGIFDTDGGVFLDKRKVYKNIYPRIIFQTVSKPLFEQLNLALSKHFTLYTRFNEKRQIYIIELYGSNQIKSWMKIIGFSNSRHSNKLLR